MLFYDNYSKQETLLKLIFTGTQLLYNVVLVSAALQNEPATQKHAPPPFWTPFPSRSPQCIKWTLLCYTAYSH